MSYHAILHHPSTGRPVCTAEIYFSFPCVFVVVEEEFRYGFFISKDEFRSMKPRLMRGGVDRGGL